MSYNIYNDPQEDVVISSPHRGDIICRKLVIEKTGSVVGNIEAVDVRNSGRIQGVVNASSIFINNQGARIRGSVFAPKVGVHPESGYEVHSSNTTPFDCSMESLISASDIRRAVEDGINLAKSKKPSRHDDQGFTIHRADETVMVQSVSVDTNPSSSASAEATTDEIETLEMVAEVAAPSPKSRSSLSAPKAVSLAPLPPLFS